MKSLCPTDWISDRVALLISEHRLDADRYANRIFRPLIPIQWSIIIGIMLLTQQQPEQVPNGLANDVGMATLGGLFSTVVALFFLRCNTGTAITKYVVTIVQLLTWAFLVVWTKGCPEAYFYGFVSLIALSLYQDRTILGVSFVFTFLTIVFDVNGWDSRDFGASANKWWQICEYTGCYAAAVGVLWLNLYRNNQHDVRICRGQSRLEQGRLDDEQLLWTRTKELKTVNRQLHDEVHTRVRAETDRERLTRKLLQASRQAGMSEVATGVLHTVGNVINSINVSADSIADRLSLARLDRLEDAVSRLGLDGSDLFHLPANDLRGQQLSKFLGLVAAQVKKQHAAIACEVESLRKNVAHISEIVSMQQSYARVTGAAERFSVAEICDRAIRIQQADLDQYEIEVERDYQELPELCSEPHKILQIIVDLISNAKYAVQQFRNTGGKILVSTSLNKGHSLLVVVQDNGLGISVENQKQIFQHGFTTRPGGSGFGLHNSVLVAHELNGTLECFSNGAGHGARFELSLPLDETPAVVINAAQFFNPLLSVEIPAFTP